MTLLDFTNDSWIQHVSYDTETKLMRIRMKGGQKSVYECEVVELETFYAFRDSPSRGTFFNENIKGRYLHHWFED